MTSPPFPNLQPLYGLILTGGQSRRMGRDKALISYHGQPHAQYLYELLRPYCEQVFLSAQAGQWRGTVLETLPTLVDQEPGFGPFGGIFTALTTYPTVNWVVLACDLAALTSETLLQLLTTAQPQRVATCFVNGDHLFPEALCSVYTPHALPHFQAARALGLYSPVRILTQADCLLITPQDPSSLVNVNAPVD